MIRLYIENFEKDKHVTLSKEHHHYVVNVMRLKDNDEIIIFNQKNGEFLCKFIYSKESIVIPTKCLRKYEKNIKSIYLAFSPIKSHLTNFIIEKATELGVNYIQPIITERTQIRNINIEKLTKIAIEASEQSERIDIPIINKAITFDKFIKSINNDINWFSALERSDSISIKDVTFENNNSGLIVGPEGGFSDEEKDLLKQFTKPTSLGKNILRTETAIIAGLSFFI